MQGMQPHTLRNFLEVKLGKNWAKFGKFGQNSDKFRPNQKSWIPKYIRSPTAMIESYS